MTSDTVAGTEWVAFTDHRDERWLFDLSFFRSSWTCIYGAGCAGIEEEVDLEGHRGCCSYGAHFSDEADLDRVMRIAAVLPDDVWELHTHRPEDTAVEDLEPLIEALTTVDDDGDRVTSTVEGACVFLNRPGFSAGPGCALHVAAVRTGIVPLEWKPEVCWQLPLRVEHHVDDNGGTTHFVRQWTRADWGESGRDLAWWCSEAPEAYCASTPVAHHLRDEVVALAGEDVADALIAHVDGRGTTVSLPEPRRRGR